LLEPFHKLAAQQKLHIIPDGLIAHIPFEALLTQAQAGDKINYRDLPYLLHQSSVSYGLSAVLFLRPLRKLSKDASLLAFGYTNGLMLRSKEPSPVDLAGTEAELDVLSKLFLHGTFLKGNEATKSNFRLHAPGSNIIHLAVHGTGDPEKDFSASLFFRSMPDSADDGQLHSYELFNYNLQAALAVLTACESGIGKTYKGEGMMSMANAFMVAGCDNVVMTLWKLNDQVSVNLIRIFYEQLLGGEDLDVALRNAKLNYLYQSDELTADPKLWAAPVVYGHGKPLIDKQTTINIILILTAGLMLMVLIVILLKMRIQRKQVSS
jgi:CHAT domain-containing protein